MRDRAIGASVRAPFGDFKVLRGDREIKLAFKSCDGGGVEFFPEKFLPVVDPDPQVNLGEFLFYEGTVTLRKTAAHNQFSAAPPGFKRGILENRFNRLFLRLAYECAGIDDYHIGDGKVDGDFVSGAFEKMQYPLAIDLVLAASEVLKGYDGHWMKIAWLFSKGFMTL